MRVVQFKVSNVQVAVIARMYSFLDIIAINNHKLTLIKSLYSVAFHNNEIICGVLPLKTSQSKRTTQLLVNGPNGQASALNISV